MSETGRGDGRTAAGAAMPPLTAQAAPESADLIYQGGDIVTIDEARPTAEAVAVRGGKILAVGLKRRALDAPRALGVPWSAVLAVENELPYLDSERLVSERIATVYGRHQAHLKLIRGGRA